MGKEFKKVGGTLPRQAFQTLWLSALLCTVHSAGSASLKAVSKYHSVECSTWRTGWLCGICIHGTLIVISRCFSTLFHPLLRSFISVILFKVSPAVRWSVRISVMQPQAPADNGSRSEITTWLMGERETDTQFHTNVYMHAQTSLHVFPCVFQCVVVCV